MLHQEINLYRAFIQPPPKSHFLNWKRFGYAQLFFIAILCIIYLHLFWNVHQLNVKKLALQTQVSELQKQFFSLKKNFPQLFFSQDVSQSVNLLQKDLETQKKVLQSLSAPLSFSQSLIALSTDIVPNVWLTAISLSKGGNDIILKGMSTTIDSLEKFIANILHDKSFAEFSINLNDVVQSDKKESNGNLIFQLNMTNRAQ